MISECRGGRVGSPNVVGGTRVAHTMFHGREAFEAFKPFEFARPFRLANKTAVVAVILLNAMRVLNGTESSGN